MSLAGERAATSRGGGGRNTIPAPWLLPLAESFQPAREETDVPLPTSFLFGTLLLFVSLRFDAKTLAILGTAGIVTPYLIYQVCVTEFVSRLLPLEATLDLGACADFCFPQPTPPFFVQLTANKAAKGWRARQKILGKGRLGRPMLVKLL